MTFPAKLAYGFMALAVLGFLGVEYWVLLNPNSSYLWFFILTRHGFEGALVGGVCDVIAVRNVYTKAKENFNPLVEGLSRTVVHDMIQVRELIEEASEVQNIFQKPEHHDWFRSQLEETVPSRESIGERINQVWDKELGYETACWLAEIDFKPILSGSYDEPMRFLEVAELRNTLAILMEVATEDESLTKETVERIRGLGASIMLSDIGLPSEEEKLVLFLDAVWLHWQEETDPSRIKMTENATEWLAKKAIRRLSKALSPVVKRTSLSDILNPILSEEYIQGTMHELAKRIREEPVKKEGVSSEIPLLYDSLILYIGALADAWSTLPQSQRQEAMVALLEVWKPVIMTMLGDVLWWLRSHLMQSEQVVEMAKFQQLVSYLSEETNKHAEDIQQHATEALERKLNKLGSDGFVSVLKKNTQAQLDWIKVNGTIYGFVLGALVGGMILIGEHIIH